MPGRLEFGVDFSTPGPAARQRDPQAPFRIALVGAFSGRSATAPLRAVPLTVDNFDAVLGRLSPSLDNGEPLATEFAKLEDFHPDALFARAPHFAELKALRRELADPATFAAAYARLGNAPDNAVTSPPVADPAQPGSAFESLIGGKPAGQVAANRSTSAVGRIIQNAVDAHGTVGADPRQGDAIAAVDLAIAEQMRTLLHDDRFRMLESLWRAAWWLVSNVDEETTEIALVDIGLAQLTGALSQGQPGGESSVAGVLAGGQPWSLLCGMFDLGADAVDKGMAPALAALAHHLGAPWVAGAAPALVGAESWTRFAANPGNAQAAMPASWSGFRATDAAGWLGLVAPRLLLRLPYGAKTDPIEAFAFEELVSPEDPASYLWAQGGIAVARLLAEEFTDDGWDMSGTGGTQRLDDLPAHSYQHDGDMQLTPCAECWLSEAGAERLLECGIMPLVSQRNANAARLVRVQALAVRATGLAGSWRG